MRIDRLEVTPDSALSWKELFESVASEFHLYKQTNERLRHDIENRIASIQTATEMLSLPDLSATEREALQRLMQRAVAELKALVENVQAVARPSQSSCVQLLSELTLN